MWLIDVNTYELQNVPNHDAWRGKPYAILSHTWGDGEVTFQDMMNGQAAWTKVGFRKIELTCREAKSDGLGYAWVDTCCIDKSSSAELQEAINSMFEWYRRAHICFAYLPDVDNISRHWGQEDSLWQSKWFTRGWTLQELIAPPDVIFFDRHWKTIGMRSTMAEQIAKHTGVDRALLQESRSSVMSHHASDPRSVLAGFSVAERMSWAAGRATTRIEDRAYSLLGLFGVSIPLLYGEGARAFVRLQEEILRIEPDPSVLLWQVSVGTANHGAIDSANALLQRLSAEQNSQSLLAPSPDVFSRCGTFSFLLSERLLSSAASRSVSSVGLQARFPVIFLPTRIPNDDAFDTLVLLNCFDDRDPSSTLALRTRRSASYGVPRVADKGAFQEKGTLYLHPMSLAEARRRRMDRLVKIDVVKAAYESVMYDVVLLRSFSLERLQTVHVARPVAPLFEMTTDYADTIWIRLEFPQESLPWTPLRAYPPKSWNIDRLTFDVAVDNGNIVDIAGDIEWTEDNEFYSTTRMPVPFIFGAVELQRIDIAISRVVIVIGSARKRTTRKDGTIKSAGLVFKLYSPPDSWSIDQDDLKWYCEHLASDYTVIPPKNLHDGTTDMLELYEGTKLYTASTFAVVSESRQIGRKKVAILHAYDWFSPENASYPAQRSSVKTRDHISFQTGGHAWTLGQ